MKILGILVWCLVVVAWVPAAVRGGEMDLLQARIDAAGAYWTAGENQITKLPVEAQNALLGGRLPETATIRQLLPPAEKNVPSHHDWRDVDGHDWMTPVKHQGNCGSCGAFAALGTLEAIIRIWTNQPGLPVDLSEQQVFSCAGGDCPTGLYMGTIFSYVTANGVADEECLPYIAVDDNCGDLCDDWQQRSEYIDGWDLLWQYQYDDEVLKSWVMLHPVACYMEVYGDFMSYSSGIYEHVTGTYRGGHFVVIVGWDDAENYWICKNSWGLDWGEDGYFRIKRGETAIGSWAMFPYYPGQPNPTVTPAPYPTPLPTATASPDLGVRLHMPHTIYRSGDTFSLDATISNPGAAMSGIPVFIVLETGGEYWFWPGWKAFPELDCQLRTIHNGMEMLQIIDPFPWPEMPYTGTTAAFWGLMLTGDFTQVLGDSDQAGFTF